MKGEGIWISIHDQRWYYRREVPVELPGLTVLEAEARLRGGTQACFEGCLALIAHYTIAERWEDIDLLLEAAEIAVRSPDLLGILYMARAASLHRRGGQGAAATGEVAEVLEAACACFYRSDAPNGVLLATALFFLAQLRYEAGQWSEAGELVAEAVAVFDDAPLSDEERAEGEEMYVGMVALFALCRAAGGGVEEARRVLQRLCDASRAPAAEDAARLLAQIEAS